MKIRFLPATIARELRNAVFGVLLPMVLIQLAGPAFCQAVYSPPCVFSTVAQLPQMPGTNTSRNADPQGIVADAAGNLCFADARHQVIYRMAPSGALTILAGRVDCPGSADGTGNQARFRYPHGLAGDAAGNLYVADSGNNTIRKITPGGAVTTLAGLARVAGCNDGKGSAARFDYPAGVAADGSGNVYVADMFNHVIRKITCAGLVTTLAGIPGTDGSTDGRGRSARFSFPTGIAVDRSGTLYIADMSNNTIRKVTPDGVVSTLAGRASYMAGKADGTGAGAQFFHPWALAVDGARNIYVADTDNNTIRRITPTGTVTTLAGAARQCGYADGGGTTARFWHPVAIAFDPAGNVYVADLANAALRKGVFAPLTNTDITLAQPNQP